MAMQEAVRAEGRFMAVSMTPDVCKTPPFATPVPYMIVGYFSNKQKEVSNVNFAGKPAFNYGSRVTTVIGDEAGSMGGVVSNTFKGYSRPLTFTPTVKAKGANILFQHAGLPLLVGMNCMGPEGPFNTVGQIVFAGAAMPAVVPPDGGIEPSPPVKAETAAEAGFLGKLLSADGLAGLAQMAPQLATADWSNPASALGAIAGVGGIPGLGQLGRVAGIAAQGASLAQADWSNPSTWTRGLGLAGSMTGNQSIAVAAQLGSSAASLTQADWKNPGSIVAAAGNLAGLAGTMLGPNKMGQRSKNVQTLSDESSGSAKTSPTKKSGQNWTEKEIKQEWNKTETGKKVLNELPKTTTFEGYDKLKGSKTNARYNPKTDTILIPNEYTSKEAAPTAAHEATHARQVQADGLGKKKQELIGMEVEAKNVGLDVYEDMGRPSLRYDYKSEANFRKKNPKKYNNAVEKHYKKKYGIK